MSRPAVPAAGPGEADPAPQLTTAAVGAAAPLGCAGLQADAKFKPRRRSVEAARGSAGGARAALNNGRLGRAQRLPAGLQRRRDRGARSSGA